MLRAPARTVEFAIEAAVPAASAETIARCDDLRYSSDAEPGFRRRKAGSGFYYLLPDGRRVKDEAMLARIRKLAVPPAYRDVWICRDAEGHLQATGIDARGRKQYRYHERWRSVRDTHKFERMTAFGRTLPRIHRRIARDLKLPGLGRDKVLATVVRLLESTLIRVGNVEYARTNRSYGLTTLRNRHASVKGTVVSFSFRGKHGIRHCIEVQDPRAAKVIRGCLDLPGTGVVRIRGRGRRSARPGLIRRERLSEGHRPARISPRRTSVPGMRPPRRSSRCSARSFGLRKKRRRA